MGEQMPTKARRRAYNGSGNLEAAMAVLIQTQAQFLQTQAQVAAHLDEDRQRFARIERDLELIKALLLKHEETLQKLPEVLRDKIGFKHK